MTFKATGPGLIEIDSTYAGAGMLKALLHNFDFDDMNIPTLKSEHSDFLRTRAIPLLAENRGRIWLEGHASHIGTHDYNVQLSRKRVQKIVDFLTTNGIVANQIQPDAVGDSSSASRLKDDELDRSVAFVILQKGHFDPPPPRKTPAAPEVTTQFRLRLSAEITITGVPRIRPPRGKLGGGPAADALLFEIQDVEHKISAFYGYSGLGMGVGVNLAWLSGTDAGPWNYFTTSAPMNIGDFGGLTRFTSAGGGNYTINYLNLLGTPPGVDAVYLKINTGTTYGGGATTTAGPLQRVAGPMPAGPD
ncbi:MAG TPA: OmpA family protein [Candidatus Sulfotelmatobacter sp.]|nr:OmpA family protein [Candidatus Sulfotelmatobacter sp.]